MTRGATTRSTTVGVLVRLGVFTAAMLALLLVVITAILRPVSGDTVGYRAEFTDVSGLRRGDDVRMYGVQVGEVTAIELSGATAVVRFTVRTDRPVYESSGLAIRYQTLTGQRYVDVRQPDRPGARLGAGATIGLDKTIPSFDITQLFNGLRPVLEEFSPGALNHFAESVLAVIQGDGSGIGPALDAFERLSRYVSDRQAVLSLIVSNLQHISDQIGGKSPHLVTLLRGIADVFTALNIELDGLLLFADTAPSALGPLNSLMATLGFTERSNPLLVRDLRLLFPDPDQALDVLGRLPGLLQTLADLLPPADGTPGRADLTCSRGPAPVPAPFAVLIAGQRIAICRN
ncbi:MCE family protein [Nocardia otitidiscaviarum]|uniref:MCE family protein n=1 Tax=Nocardia otitidiscaviarum TaxID=1823 RepID=A0A516NN08_9NOCA|nr:MlaD family protein [Nocardia otitidiscaviarum]MCP9625262.1 MCE family protein [Nocardia otitidiscaviarum]QDP80281.1 MCE family protein [Nocardia otitidiscaviarum]